MRRTKEQKNKLSRSVVFSIIFHLLLFCFIILGSLDEIIKLGSGGQGGEVVDAIMVDPGVVVEQYNQLQRQKNSIKQADVERKKRIQQQEEELRKQQEEEKKRLKIVEEERIKIARETETEQQRKKTERVAQEAKKRQKITEEEAARFKAEQRQIIKEQADTKAKTEAQAKKEAEMVRAKAQAEEKEKAEKDAANALLAAKKKADAAKKQTATVDSLLSVLTAQQPTQQTGGIEAASQGGNRKNGASSSDVANYAGKIKAAIEIKFYDADIYRGKICELNIKLAPDGRLISIVAKSNTENDQLLCDGAIRAAKTAIMPKPPSRSIYDAFSEQGGTLVFKP